MDKFELILNLSQSINCDYLLLLLLFLLFLLSDVAGITENNKQYLPFFIVVPQVEKSSKYLKQKMERIIQRLE